MKKGFTLIELVIMMLIISITMAVAVQRNEGTINDLEKGLITDMTNTKNTIDLFYNNYNSVPDVPMTINSWTNNKLKYGGVQSNYSIKPVYSNIITLNAKMCSSGNNGLLIGVYNEKIDKKIEVLNCDMVVNTNNIVVPPAPVSTSPTVFDPTTLTVETKDIDQTDKRLAKLYLQLNNLISVHSTVKSLYSSKMNYYYKVPVTSFSSYGIYTPSISATNSTTDYDSNNAYSVRYVDTAGNYISTPYYYKLYTYMFVNIKLLQCNTVGINNGELYTVASSDYPYYLTYNSCLDQTTLQKIPKNATYNNFYNSIK